MFRVDNRGSAFLQIVSCSESSHDALFRLIAESRGKDDQHSRGTPTDIPWWTLQNGFWGHSPPASSNSTTNTLQWATAANNQAPAQQRSHPSNQTFPEASRTPPTTKTESIGQTDGSRCTNTRSTWWGCVTSEVEQLVNWSPYAWEERHNSTDEYRQYRLSRHIREWSTLGTAARRTVCHELTVGWWSIRVCVISSQKHLLRPNICRYFVKLDALHGESSLYACRPEFSK